MTRMVAMTFFGEKRWADDAHPHESPKVMTGPLIVLAVLSFVGGAVLELNNRLPDFLSPGVRARGDRGRTSLPTWVLTTVTARARRASASACAFYVVRRAAGGRGSRRVDVNPLTTAARRDLYGDAFNEAVFMRPGQYLTRFLVCFDNRVVDGAVNGLRRAGRRPVGRVPPACRPASPARTPCPCSPARPSWSSPSSW